MEISIRPETQRFLEQKMQSGAYRSIDEVIEAGLAALENMQETFGDFAPGELDELLAEADEDFEKGKVYEGEEVVQELREMSVAKRRETH
jgi:putative addiction module CopG family antidote